MTVNLKKKHKQTTYIYISDINTSIQLSAIINFIIYISDVNTSIQFSTIIV